MFDVRAMYDCLPGWGKKVFYVFLVILDLVASSGLIMYMVNFMIIPWILPESTNLINYWQGGLIYILCSVINYWYKNFKYPFSYVKSTWNACIVKLIVLAFCSLYLAIFVPV